MEPTLKIKIEKPVEDKYQIIRFDGDFDKAGYSDIRNDLDKFFKGFKSKIVVFDFAKLKFINSEAIGYLMEIHTHLTKRDMKLVIVGLRENVKDILKTIGINEIIPIHDNMDSFLKK